MEAALRKTAIVLNELVKTKAVDAKLRELLHRRALEMCFH